MRLQLFKNKLSKRFYWIPGLILLAILVHTFLGEKGVYGLRPLLQERNEISARLTVVRAENEQLKTEIQALHNSSYIEKLAREDLGLAHNNEVVYKFANTNNTPKDKN